MKKPTSFCCFLLLFFGCSSCFPDSERYVNRAFYFWKGTFTLPPPELQAMDSLHVRTLYVKFFDVDLDVVERAVPIAKIAFDSAMPDSLSLIPTVFITNRTFSKLNASEVDVLAAKIRKKVFAMLSRTQTHPVKEIQLDCDWSASTKENYFRLLRKIRSDIKPVQLSATIRLHQLKYFSKTGVPPVDKGMLMFYNMSKVNELGTSNSILDLREAKKYLNTAQPYPLRLDIALPIFSWAVVFRNGRFLGLLNNVREGEVARLSFLKKLENQRYVSTKDTVFEGTYLRNGDQIRVEGASPDDLSEAAELLSHFAPQDTVTVSFFHWDSHLLEQYEHGYLEKVYNSFH